MIELVIGAAISIASLFISGKINLKNSEQNAKQNLESQIALLNRNETITTYKELAALLGNINWFFPVFLKEEERAKTMNDFKEATIALCRYWEINRGKILLFVPSDIIEHLKLFVYNLSVVNEYVSDFKEQDEFEQLNSLASESREIINLLRNQVS